MSYYDAIADNIPIEKDNRGFSIYYPPCHICGTSVKSWSYVSGCKYTCHECRTELISNHTADIAKNSSDKQRECLKRAVKRISHMTDISGYAEAIKRVESHIGKNGWFQSTEEVMVALELIRLKVKTHHQVKIYNYRVDFILPEYKVALEIDGEIYHGKERRHYEEIRDEAICTKLGEGWEIIHIDTKNINMNIRRLMPAVKAVLKRRNKLKGKSL
ncbi:MAG: DUF559 domain-containing protein [Ruminococcus sp.]|nr:DUF559 domain-containing protein [Ruminococcus sp.]